MNKNELVLAVKHETGLTMKDTKKIIDCFFDTVIETTAGGEKIQILGFGTFEKRLRKERKGKNPLTGKEIIISESFSPVFKAGKTFKAMVKNK